jgi:hypothetical protein
MNDVNKNKIPKKIWMIWFQGFEQSPEIIKECRSSWERHNPDWEIIYLDSNTIHDYIEVKEFTDNKNMSIQALSNIFRLELLKKYGGVWADATLYCTKPLENWIFEAVEESGYFAFSKPGYDRMLSSWFMAAKPENELVKAWLERTKNYWRFGLTAPNIIRRIGFKACHIFIHKIKLFVVVKQFIYPMKIFGIYPYNVFHHLFEKEYKKNIDVRKIWDNSKTISSDLPHKISHYGLTKEINTEIEDFIDSNQTPLHKLKWAIDIKNSNENSVIKYLLNKEN